jgi:hypothetical protein
MWSIPMKEDVMNVSAARPAIPARAGAAVSVEIPQYRKRAIFAVWAAAALPMAALAWLVVPVLEDRFAGGGHVPMAKALIASLVVGLVWQFVLVAVLVGREQRSLRWSTNPRCALAPFSADLRVFAQAWRNMELLETAPADVVGDVHGLVGGVRAPARKSAVVPPGPVKVASSGPYDTMTPEATNYDYEAAPTPPGRRLEV